MQVVSSFEVFDSLSTSFDELMDETPENCHSISSEFDHFVAEEVTWRLAVFMQRCRRLSGTEIVQQIGRENRIPAAWVGNNPQKTCLLLGIPVTIERI